MRVARGEQPVLISAAERGSTAADSEHDDRCGRPYGREPERGPGGAHDDHGTDGSGRSHAREPERLDEIEADFDRIDSALSALDSDDLEAAEALATGLCAITGPDTGAGA